MKQFYTMKDICRLLNVTRETLRHYEREGLIHPKINASNQYRLYDEHQMYLISECKRYQQNGFCLDEIRSMLEADDLAAYTDRIESRKDLFAGIIREYQMKLDLINEYHKKLLQIPELLECPEIVTTQDVFFAPLRSSDRLRLSDADIIANRIMGEHLYVTFMMMYDRKGNPEWGFGMYGRFLSENTDSEKLVRIPSCRAVRMIADCAKEEDLEKRILNPMRDYAKQSGYTYSDEFFMIQLFRSGREKDTHRYFEAYLPLRDD